MRNLLNEFELFELENKTKLNIIGGRRSVTSTVVVGTTGPDANGATTMDLVCVGTDGSWCGDPMCDQPDADWGGIKPIGTEVG